MIYQTIKKVFNNTCFIILLIILGSRVSFADGCTPISDPPTLDEIACPIDKGLEVLVYSSGAGFIGMILYGSIKYSLSQGDSKGVEGAKLTLTWGVVGFLIVIGVVAISNIALSVFNASISTTLAQIILEILGFLEANQCLFKTCPT